MLVDCLLVENVPRETLPVHSFCVKAKKHYCLVSEVSYSLAYSCLQAAQMLGLIKADFCPSQGLATCSRCSAARLSAAAVVAEVVVVGRMGCLAVAHSSLAPHKVNRVKRCQREILPPGRTVFLLLETFDLQPGGSGVVDCKVSVLIVSKCIFYKCRSA